MKVDVTEFSTISVRSLDYLDDIIEMKMRRKWVDSHQEINQQVLTDYAFRSQLGQLYKKNEKKFFRKGTNLNKALHANL